MTNDPLAASLKVIQTSSISHWVKSVQIRIFFWSVFSRIQTEYGEIRRSLRIQSNCGKIRTRINSVLWHFLHSGCKNNLERNQTKPILKDLAYLGLKQNRKSPSGSSKRKTIETEFKYNISQIYSLVNEFLYLHIFNVGI